MEAQLFAPESYNTASQAVRDQVCNGCGSSGWKGDLIPNRILGLDIKPACDRHDWMYACGQTMADKEEADDVFLNNMLRIIDAGDGWWSQFRTIRNLRRDAAKGYYEAVKIFGGPAFWEGKNPAANMLLTTA